MSGRAFGVVVGLETERVGLAVAVQEAGHLLHAARNAQDGVGDVGFAGPLICSRRPSLSMIEVPANSTPAHPGLGRIEHRIEKLERDLAVRVVGEQLIELDRFAHHRVVEERHVHRLFQPLEHLLGLARTANTARPSSCRRARETESKGRRAPPARRSRPVCIARSRRAAAVSSRPVRRAAKRRPTRAARGRRGQARQARSCCPCRSHGSSPPSRGARCPRAESERNGKSAPCQRRHCR